MFLLWPGHVMKIGKARCRRARRRTAAAGQAVSNRRERAARPPPRRSGEGLPVGAFGAVGAGRRQRGLHPGQGVRVGHPLRWPAGLHAHGAARAVAHVAIEVGASGRGGWRRRPVVRSRGIRRGTGRGCVVVLMLVVAEVRRLGRGFVAAVWRCSRPDALERQEHQQEDEQQAAHGRERILRTGAQACGHCPCRAADYYAFDSW